MFTKWKLIRPDGVIQEFENELNKDPGYDMLRSIISPLIERGPLEHVSVWADYDFGEDCKALDMFVNENGLIQKLPRNKKATDIYRNYVMSGRGVQPAPKNPEKLDFVVGPAVLFSRRVWF